ncbi:MAG: cobalt ECF transporter T component CbiQ, partial [Rhodospirillaceae bacterium]|nr:cobalt ECF transporter T component CbiQ [Rhodospirillaceae bacterium]
LNAFPPLLVALATGFALMILADLPPIATFKRVAMMDGFIIFMLVLLPFTTPGEAVLTVAGFPASREGFVLAGRIALKANAVVLAAMALVGTMEPVTLGHALYRLKVPENLVLLMLFTVRYIEVIHQEYQRMRLAMRARGFRPANTCHTYKSLGYLIGMMLVRALERSDRIRAAMKCRGFSGRLEILDTLRYRRRDGAFAVLAVLLLGGLLFMECAYVLVF